MEVSLQNSIDPLYLAISFKMKFCGKVYSIPGLLQSCDQKPLANCDPQSEIIVSVSLGGCQIYVTDILTKLGREIVVQ
jgi:hypothetical protein